MCARKGDLSPANCLHENRKSPKKSPLEIMNADDRFLDDRFPRSNAYHPEWIAATAGGGANSLWLTEWLTSALELKPGMWCLHSPAWWRRHWERTGIVDVELADTMPDGWRYWSKWHRAIAPDNQIEIEAVEQDRGNYLGYVRVIGRRRPHVPLNDPVVTVPSRYVSKPLLRDHP
jgi:hypothetical protein